MREDARSGAAWYLNMLKNVSKGTYVISFKILASHYRAMTSGAGVNEPIELLTILLPTPLFPK